MSDTRQMPIAESNSIGGGLWPAATILQAETDLGRPGSDFAVLVSHFGEVLPWVAFSEAAHG